MLIPTYNRSEMAVGTVQAWLPQLQAHDAEIVVVDDGSDPHHATYLQEHLGNVPRVILVRQSNAGLSAARNAALGASRGEYVYFIDDDIRPGDNNAVNKALERVQATNQPVVGRTRVPKAFRPTVVQELWHQRFVNGTERFMDGQELGVTGFWFAAMITPRAALHGQKFATHFRGYGWEEHELGYRLHEQGVRVQFCKDLWYEHLDMVTLSGLLKKYEAMGAQGVTFSQLHPGPKVAFLTGSAWISRFVKTVLQFIPRGDRAVRELAEYADGEFVGDTKQLAVLQKRLFIALEGAYFHGMLAELHDRNRA